MNKLKTLSLIACVVVSMASCKKDDQAVTPVTPPVVKTDSLKLLSGWWEIPETFALYFGGDKFYAAKYISKTADGTYTDIGDWKLQKDTLLIISKANANAQVMIQRKRINKLSKDTLILDRQLYRRSTKADPDPLPLTEVVTTLNIPGQPSTLYAGGAITKDPEGNIYFVYRAGSFKAIIKLDVKTGVFTKMAGYMIRDAGLNNGSYDDGVSANELLMWNPSGLVVDSKKNIYFIDDDNWLRVISATTGRVSTILRTYDMNSLHSLSIDANDNVYFVYNKVPDVAIKKLAPDGTISDIVKCKLNPVFSGDNGLAANATVLPGALTVTPKGDIFFLTHNTRMCKIDATTGILTTILGNETAAVSGDGGPALAARVNYVAQICVSRAGEVYFTDREGYSSQSAKIRKIGTDGKVNTIAGNFSFLPDTYQGPSLYAITATVNPGGMFLNDDGSLIFTHTGTYYSAIMKVGPKR